MCEVKLLVVGDSESRNLEAIRSVSEKLLDTAGIGVCLSCDKVGCEFPLEVDTDDYDIVAIDDHAAPTDCGHAMIGSDVPVVFFSDLARNSFSAARRAGDIIASVISHAIARGNLRDKISSITDEIEQTSRMLASV